MPKSKTFEEQYPTIHRFVEEIGWIEIGRREMISAFVRAYDLAALFTRAKMAIPAWKLHFRI